MKMKLINDEVRNFIAGADLILNAPDCSQCGHKMDVIVIIEGEMKSVRYYCSGCKIWSGANYDNNV